MQTQTISRNTLLHRALQLDAIASGALGALLVLTSGPTGRLLELPAALLFGAGVAMLGWAAVTGWLGTRTVVPRRGATAVIVINLLWAVDSIVLLLTGWLEPNGLGVVFVVGQALVVLALAELQYVGLRRAGR